MPEQPDRGLVLEKVIFRTRWRYGDLSEQAFALTDEFVSPSLRRALRSTILSAKEAIAFRQSPRLREFAPFSFDSQPLEVLLIQLEALLSVPQAAVDGR